MLDFRNLSLLGALPGLLSGGLSAAVVVQDGFDDGDSADGLDPLDLQWSATSAVASGGFQPGTGNYFELVAGGEWDQRNGTLPTNPLLDLQVGQTLTLTFNMGYAGAPENDPDGFRFGILGASGSRVGIGALVGTGTSTNLSLQYDRVSGGDNFGGIEAGNNVSYSGQTKTAMSAGLADGVSSTFSLSLTRHANSLDVLAEVNGGTAAVTVSDSHEGFFTDFSAGQIIIRSGGVTQNFHFDDVQITVVPEPGAVMLLGLAGILGLRRRR
ncbi:MAG: PEP-CTERM sorting domain-containing protein [Verrucomicrobiales bacterium]